MFIARTRSYDDKTQSIKLHSEQTAKLASDYAIDPLKDLAYNCGIAHDFGKYTQSFQQKITTSPNLKVSHALCGAIELKNISTANSITKMMLYCIAGHHAGLHNFGVKADYQPGTLCGTLNQKTEDYSAYKSELTLKEIDMPKALAFIKKDCNNADEKAEKYAFLTRYLFSCLTDADSLNSEFFETQEERTPLSSDFKTCLELIDQKLASFKPKTELQKTRSIIQQQVFDKAEQKADIYLMNMPTGSGKTMCSLKFALQKALSQEKKRIIYVIPYNSIIDQMSKTVEDTFKESISLLRHQSTFQFENAESEEEQLAFKKATENWDADFIVTTAVQFFESVYSNKRGKLRKMHNLADSIIIFDEAHLMPIDYLMPCLHVIAHITKTLNSEAVFLTATMPNFDNLLGGFSNLKLLDLVDDKSDFPKFDTCDYSYIGFDDYEQLVEHSLKFKSKLIVCNSKQVARDIFRQCSGEKYHLSTYMTVEHRQKTIEKIRQRLQDDVPITVVSTSLIEAGVDLDFNVVYREMTGLDSILQSGGRCNREGKLARGNVFIFKFPQTKPYDIKSSITEGIIKDFPNILDGVKAYYEILYTAKEEEINRNLLKLDGLKYFQIPFREYSHKFKLISDSSVSLVVPYDPQSQAIVEQMKFSGIPQPKKLQKYLCNIHINQISELNGAIEEHAGMFCLTNLDYYDSQVGLTFEGKDYII